MKEELQEKLARAARYFQIAEEFKEQVRIQEETIYETQLQFTKEKNKKIDRLKIIRFLAILLFLFAVLVFFVAMETFSWEFPKSEDDRQILNIACVIPSLISCICVAVTTVAIRKKERKYDLLYKGEIEPRVKQYEGELQRTKDLIVKFVEENIHVIEFLPMQYRDIHAVSYMLVAVSNGRADSLKEVYNLYEEQLHRWKLEDAAMESLQAQEYMMQAAQETNQHLKQIEFMQYLQYLQNSNNADK